MESTTRVQVENWKALSYYNVSEATDYDKKLIKKYDNNINDNYSFCVVRYDGMKKIAAFENETVQPDPFIANTRVLLVDKYTTL